MVDANAPIAFIVNALAAWEAGTPVFPVDPRLPEEARAKLVARASGIDPRTALLLSTSGTSAEPKLVMLGADGLAANIQAILRYLPIKASPRTAVIVPLSYSYGLVGQVLTTLEAGGTLLLLGDLTFPVDQLARMRDLGAQGLSTVPASLRLLARATLEPLSLDYVASAGGPLDDATIELARRAFRPRAFYNQYGLTEASPRVTGGLADGSVGRPLEGVDVTIDAPDEHGEGEILVRGPGVMLGYLGDPEGTARVLEDGVLRTGDRGRLEDGRLFVTGRADGVVKVAGERVGLEEVAAVLRAAEGVTEAAVIAVPHDELGFRLHAFVEGDAKAAREAAKRFLGPAKRPRIVAIESLPRTSNGKVALGELAKLVNP